MLVAIIVDNMDAALLPDERTSLVSTNRLGHGWAYQKTDQSASHYPSWLQGWFVIGCQPIELQSISRDKSGALNSMLKKFNAASILSILLVC